MPRRGPDPVLTRREARQGVELATRGMALLIEAREIFASCGHPNTADRVRAAISSGKGAVRVAQYREGRAAEREEIDREAEAGAAEVEAERAEAAGELLDPEHDARSALFHALMNDGDHLTANAAGWLDARLSELGELRARAKGGAALRDQVTRVLRLLWGCFEDGGENGAGGRVLTANMTADAEVVREVCGLLGMELETLPTHGREVGRSGPACCLYHATGGVAGLDCGDDAVGCLGPDGAARQAAAARRVAEAHR